MTSSSRDIECRASALGPFHEEIEVRSVAMRSALPIQLDPIVPRETHGHAASSTARRAASSMVGST